METKWTKGEWTACNMVHAETGERLTPDEIGEYVANSIRVRPECDDFLFISAEKEDGPCDVCHIGNGPDGPANARLIATAKRLYETLENLVRLHVAEEEGISSGMPTPREWYIAVDNAAEALAAARGEAGEVGDE